MSCTYKFMDNAYYGIEDLNNLVKSFTTGGVNVYSGTSGQLNDMTAALVGSGTQMWNDACKATVYNSQIKLNPGVVFFDDGSSLTIEAGGEILPNGRYIYIKKDGENSRPVSSSTPPSSNDIPIAEYANGTLTDKRKFAQSKVAGFGTNQYYEVSLNGTYSISAGAETVAAHTTIKTINFNTTPSTFNFAVFSHKTSAKEMCYGLMKFSATDTTKNDYYYLSAQGDNGSALLEEHITEKTTDFWLKRTGGDIKRNMYLYVELVSGQAIVKVKNFSGQTSITLDNTKLTFC